MLGYLHRLWRLNYRSEQARSSKRYTADQPALTVAGEDSLDSDSWTTLNEQEALDNCQVGQQDRAKAKSKVQSSKKTSLISPRAFFKAAIKKLGIRYRDEFVVDEDISNGRERYKIPAISYVRDDEPPLDFQYVCEYIQQDCIHMDLSLSAMRSCRCPSDCKSFDCLCSKLANHACRYDSRGRLGLQYCMEAPEAIFECNAGCKCNFKECGNRVIQQGSRAKLILFRTRSRGWGVRTVEGLKRGSFVGVYSGELVSAAKSCDREDDSYLFNLSNSNIIQPHKLGQRPGLDGQAGTQTGPEVESEVGAPNDPDEAGSDQFVCDAKQYGNVTRFINHSCQPNVIAVRSFTEHQDPRFPYIAFFANSDIEPDAELTLNYGDNYWLVKCSRDKIFCLCKRSSCRFSRKSFPATYKLYKEQQRKSRQPS